MTAREAHELVRSIEALWRIDLGSDGRELWATSLAKYDSPAATQAVIQLSERQRDRPTLADVRHMIAKVIRDRTPTPALPPTPGGEIPLWVKRWTCARYLHAMFGRAHDDRRFPEQGDWRHPNAPVMPDHEWAEEAARIRSSDVYATINHGRTAGGTQPTNLSSYERPTA